jgi:hypothetical protein
MTESKMSILDMIGNVDQRVKEDIIETVKEDTPSQDKVSIGRKVENSILHFDISNDDDEFLLFIKEEINKANMTKEDLYNIYDRSEAYNMIYTLKQGVISIPRLKKWLYALGKELVLTTRDITEE